MTVHLGIAVKIHLIRYISADLPGRTKVPMTAEQAHRCQLPRRSIGTTSSSASSHSVEASPPPR